MINTMIAMAERVDSLDLSPETPASELPFGLSAPYWLDLRGRTKDVGYKGPLWGREVSRVIADAPRSSPGLG